MFETVGQPNMLHILYDCIQDTNMFLLWGSGGLLFSVIITNTFAYLSLYVISEMYLFFFLYDTVVTLYYLN